MTDSRVSRGIAQVLARAVPDARVSRGVAQVLARAVPDARVSRAVVQVLTRSAPVPTTTRPFVRTVGSPRPLLMKQPDDSWWPVQLKPPPDLYKDAVLADTPAGYWRLGEPSGSSFADTSGNSRTGTWVNRPAAVTGLLVGKADGAADFNGTSHYGTVPNGTWMNATQLTMEAIVQTDTAAGVHCILDRDNESGARLFQWRISSGKPELLLWTSGLFVAASTTALTAGVTYHLAAVYNGSTITLYRNGVVDATAACTGNPATGSIAMYVGTHVPLNQYWDGRIDEVAFYPTALSATRIAAHNTART